MCYRKSIVLGTYDNFDAYKVADIHSFGIDNTLWEVW